MSGGSKKKIFDIKDFVSYWWVNCPPFAHLI